ncbi:MAG: YggT family protein [Chloroflexi bacterium]|nr:YggT family protein [Anaerolinea sp.]TDA64926.1 MAG: YggT family protein [Chloroflexota bacterium]
MLISILINIIQTLSTVLLLAVLASVLLSYFLPPYNNIRVFLDRIVNPLLIPIRRVVPPLGMIDFSPVVLIILIQVVEWILISILSRLR